MSGTTDELHSLFASLANLKWQHEGNRWIAPKGTLWLYYEDRPFWGSGLELLDMMRGRLARILANREIACQINSEQWQQSYTDTRDLVICLEGLYGHGEDSGEAANERD